MPCRSIFPAVKNLTAKLTGKENKTIEILQDFAREDFVNPFEELARMKLQAKKLLKELKKEQ